MMNSKKDNEMASTELPTGWKVLRVYTCSSLDQERCATRFPSRVGSAKNRREERGGVIWDHMPQANLTFEQLQLNYDMRSDGRPP